MAVEAHNPFRNLYKGGDRMILIFGIILGVVCLDQFTKGLAMVYLPEVGDSVPIWQDVFHFTRVNNPGAAWGMFSDARWVFMITSTVAIVGVLFYLLKYRPTSKWLTVSLSMIVGGGIGNMIDRVYLQYVVDFLDFTLIDFPVFNVADSFVSVGAVMLIGYLVMDMINDFKKSKKTTVDGEETESDHE